MAQLKMHNLLDDRHLLLWRFLLLFSLLSGTLGTPPKLVDQSVWFFNDTILNVEYEMAVVHLEFDQDIYLSGETFLCGEAEKECAPPNDCVPCDWSSQEPTGCDNVNCCGPAQVGGEIFDQVNEWCEPSTPYYSLELGERSPVVDLQPQETAYFRFFIPEEVHCKPFQIFIRPFYGVPVFFLSSLHAFPNTDTATWRKGKIPPNLGWAQNSFVVCPTAHPDYRLGTYSLGVYAWFSASFYVEIVVSPQDYPLVPPPGRIMCDQVPEEQLIDALGGSDNDVYCLQDTESLLQDYLEEDVGDLVQYILPIPSGCHQVSFAATGTALGTDPDIYCLPADTSAQVDLDNAIIARWTTGDDRLTFSMCTDEISYVRCAANFWFPGSVSVIFSTVSFPHQTPLAPSEDTPAVSITYQEGLTAVAPVIFGQAGTTCSDFYSSCYSWIVPPISDPLIFWPPSSQLPKIDTEGTNVYRLYYDAMKLHPLDKSLIAVIVLSTEEQVVFPRSRLDELSLSLVYITNELGEAPSLPNNAPDLNAKSQASPSVYSPTIAFSSLDKIDIASLCDKSTYLTLQEIVDDQLSIILDAPLLKTIECHKYTLDTINAGRAGSSCTAAALEAMKSRVESVTLVSQTFCQFEADTPEWLEDPCCNEELQARYCCAQFTIVKDEEQFTTADTSMCGVSECADTYFGDLAQALNYANNPIQGCSSGVKDFQAKFTTSVEIQLQFVIRYCLNKVGLRDDFEGIDCVADFQCEQWSGKCNHQTHKCVLGSTEETEDAYLRCYIERMSPSLEDYLRRLILPPELSGPRDTEEFFLELKAAATVNDCIAENEPLDIFLRSRYVWTALISCQASVLGLAEGDVEGIQALCPSGYCLGTACRQSTAQCFRFCEPIYKYFPSDESECIESSTICPITGLPGECEGSHCMYCPGGEEEGCQYVSGDQDFCENTVACELDGTVIFGLTEDECNAQSGYCTVDCPGESCRSLDGVDGACFAATVGSQSECEDLNSFSGVTVVWYEDTLCVISSESEASSCAELSSVISLPTTWETCESNPTTSCDGTDSYQRYLKCFVDLWHTCTTQEECENSGHCTDRPWTTIVRSDEQPIDVQFGACFNSESHCVISTDRPGIGCRERVVLSPEGCPEFNIINEEWIWRAWLTPAMSEEECVNKDDSRYGCQLPGTEQTLVWLGDEDCSCGGGVNKYAWEWTPGVWKNGASQTLQWKEVQPVQKYKWAPALSFELLQTWSERNDEQRFANALKSEVVCESVSVSSVLNSLVCDCLSDSGDSAESCYDQQDDEVEHMLGLCYACIELGAFVKSPSSRLIFGSDSVDVGCTSVNISIVKEAWFAVSPPKPSISFEFEDKPQRGTVLNQHSAIVGVLKGDGSVIKFSHLEKVVYFTVCLLVENRTDDPRYPVMDFGFSRDSIGTIFPLGMPNITIDVVFSSVFWCGVVNVSNYPLDEGNIRVFPIKRVENFESQEEDYTSQKTRALMYTLGVCYCICFVLLGFYVVGFFLNGLTPPMLGIISILLVILCVFRIVFMFGYPNAIFEDNELAEFVVFEIPTFLLFSVVIVSIFFWKNIFMATKKKFFGEDTNKVQGVIFLGLVFVWGLWIVVTIVYAEVILEQDGSSSCPGRVALSYDKQEEDTRTLTIIYQSLIISVTFILGAIFCYYSFTLLQISKDVSRPKRFVMVIGGVIVLSFFIRCILFIIILAADFVSSVYMFVTLMITEVFLLFFLQLRFNSSYLRFLAGSSASTSKFSTPPEFFFKKGPLQQSPTQSPTQSPQPTMDD